MAAKLESIWLDQVPGTPDSGNGIFRIRGDMLAYLRSPGTLVRQPATAVADVTRDSVFFARAMLDRLSGFLTQAGPLERRAMEFIDLSALFSAEPLEGLVRRNVNLETVRSSATALRVVATDWTSGKPRVFSNQEMTHEAVRASAAIPSVFPTVKIEGVPYADGAVSMDTPMKPAVDAGADVLHVIAVQTELKNIPLSAHPSTLDTLERMLAIARDGQLATDLRLAAILNRQAGRNPKYRKITVHIYRPRSDMPGGILGMLDFGRDRVRKIIDAGHQEAVNHNCQASGCLLPES